MLPLEKRASGGSGLGKLAPWNPLIPGGVGRDSNHFVLWGGPWFPLATSASPAKTLGESALCGDGLRVSLDV